MELELSDLKRDLASLRIEREHAPHRLWPWLLLFTVLALAAVGYLYLGRLRSVLGAVEVETVQASLAQSSQPQAGEPVLTASGYIVPRRKAVVSAKIQGRLSQLNVEEGSRVKEGEVIARLESAEFEAQIAQARAQIQRAEAELAEAQRQYRIAQGLAQQGIFSRDQREAAESRVALTEAALAQAKADLALQEALYQNTLIRAPFSGVVVKKMAEVGESVAPIPPGVNISTSSGAIVALADFETLEAEVDVSESNLSKLSAGQPAEISVDAFPDRSYRGELRQIIPSADRTKATVQVKVSFREREPRLRPEMSTNVTFLAPESRPSQAAAKAEPTVTVPREAVVVRDGEKVIFEVVEDRARARSVRTGVENQGRVVVESGLSGGEMVVVAPPEKLRDGDPVKPKG